MGGEGVDAPLEKLFRRALADRREQGRLGEMEEPTRAYATSHADVPAIRVALAFLLAESGRPAAVV